MPLVRAVAADSETSDPSGLGCNPQPWPHLTSCSFPLILSLTSYSDLNCSHWAPSLSCIFFPHSPVMACLLLVFCEICISQWVNPTMFSLGNPWPALHTCTCAHGILNCSWRLIGSAPIPYICKKRRALILPSSLVYSNCLAYISTDMCYDMNLKALYWVKEVSHKRPHIILFHLYEIPRISQYIEIESMFVTARSRKKGKIRVADNWYKVSFSGN